MPLPLGFVPPCLPIKAPQAPTGDAWLHEIKHDGFRVIARKDGTRIKLYSRPGNDLTYRFTLIVEALARLRSRSCIIDGEAVCYDHHGMPSFDRIRRVGPDRDRRVRTGARTPRNAQGDLGGVAETRGSRSAPQRAHRGRWSHGVRARLQDGPRRHRVKASPYRSGRSGDWLKCKNPACEAVRREAEEDWAVTGK
jgi:bifunctional non-homologous end joining protein LigD